MDAVSCEENCALSVVVQPRHCGFKWLADPDERIAFIRTHTDAALAGKPTGLVPFDALM